MTNDGDYMDFNIYKQDIKKKLAGFFDIQEDYKYKDMNFDIFAVFNSRNERYIASKSVTIYAFENDEYCFVKNFKEINKKIFEDYLSILRESIEDYVDPHNEHMSSTITGVLVVDSLNDKDLIKKVKKFKYQKSFLFGLKGWCDIRLILVDLENKDVFTSKKANEVSKFYQPQI